MASRAFQEIDEAKARARAVDLPQVAREMGYTIIRTGNGYMCKEMDSLKFYKKGEIWRWHRFSTDQSGDAISFVQEFTNCTKFMDAINYLVGDSYSYKAVKTMESHKQQESKEPPKVFEPPAENDNAHRAYAYLTKTRGIDSDIVRELIDSGYISQEKKHGNVIFKIRDEKGKYIGAELVGTYTGSRFKQISEGLKEGYGFEVCVGNGKEIYFFESAIDMISYMQINKDCMENKRFVSMGGLKHTIVEKTMERYNISSNMVYLCTDNDEKGNLFVTKMREKFPDMNRFKPACGKDWNEYINSNMFAKITALTYKCKEVERKYIDLRNELGLEMCVSYYAERCAMFLSSIGIPTTEEDICDRIVLYDLSESSKITNACLKETADIIYENSLGDFEIERKGDKQYRLTDINGKILSTGTFDSVLSGLKTHFDLKPVKEVYQFIGR